MTGEMGNTDVQVLCGETPQQLRLENQLCFPLYACARKVVNLYTPYLKPLGLTYTQYLVFMVLWEQGKISVRDLGRRLMLDSGTLTPLLKKMEEAGHLTRTRSKQDERVVNIELTEEGWGVRDKVKDVPFLIGGCVPLTPEEGQSLYKMLYKILKSEAENEEAAQ